MLQPKLTKKHLEKQLASWAKLWGHALTDASILSLSDVRGSTGQVVSVNLRGNVFLAELQAPSGSAQRVVVDAQTRSAWPALKTSISSALEVASKRPFTDFITALWSALPPPEETAEEMTEDVNLAPEEAQRYRVEDNMTDAGDSDAEAEQSCTVQESGNAELCMEAETAPKSDAQLFCQWLHDRRPLWRYDTSVGKLAWDFPMSKTEKREYVLLNTMGELDECKDDMECVKEDNANLLNEVEFLHMEREQGGDFHDASLAEGEAI
jgi:hypothetical protein